MASSFQRARQPKQPLEAAALYEYAVRSLGRKMRTVAELKRLLRRRVEADETGDAKITAVLLRLQEQRYLDDTVYANEFARLRQEHEKFGKRRVQQDLMQRGVPGEIVTTTLDALYDGIPEETQVRRFLERKRLRPPEDDKQTARIVRMLIRAGFRTGSIFKVLKQWNVPEETLAAVESIDETSVLAENPEEE